MPNSCNSITKIILIFFLIFLGSCSSTSHSTFSENLYVGKFSFTNEINASNFNIKIKALPKNVIIQIGKPLFGNLLNIEFNYSNGFSFNPKIDGDYLDLLKNFDSNEYIYFFESCLKNLENNKRPFIIKKFNFELKCNHQNTGTILIHLIYGEEMIIKGILRRG
tara:strand:- start:807 stop:1298 length:492 start_codon:yes stop_codon:yes gene_type:complete